MSRNERYFLNGMIRALKPKKILEGGVSSGGGSAIILNAISDIEGAELYSVDYSKKAYRHPEKPSGFLVEEKFPQFMDKWHIFRGRDCSYFLEDIGGGIDLLMLDTVHVHPMETLNFLCVLPFMRLTGSYAVLHDISLFAYPKSRNSLACRYLFGHVVSDEKLSPAPDTEGLPPNIGAFRVSDVTMRYVDNLFESLLIPWGFKVQPRDLEDISAIIRKYYSPEQYKFFCKAIEFQDYMDKRIKKDGIGFKAALKLWKPGVYSFLRKIRHPFTK